MDDATEARHCNYCDQDKPASDFAARSRWKCRACASVHMRQWRQDNREHHLAYQREWARASDRKHAKKSYARCKFRDRKWVWEYKLANPCVDCGEADPRVLDFDHITDDKVNNIARLMGKGLGALQREVAKCVVRCRNCHGRITAERGGFYTHDWFINGVPDEFAWDESNP